MTDVGSRGQLSGSGPHLAMDRNASVGSNPTFLWSANPGYADPQSVLCHPVGSSVIGIRYIASHLSSVIWSVPRLSRFGTRSSIREMFWRGSFAQGVVHNRLWIGVDKWITRMVLHELP